MSVLGFIFIKRSFLLKKKLIIAKFKTVLYYIITAISDRKDFLVFVFMFLKFYF